MLVVHYNYRTRRYRLPKIVSVSATEMEPGPIFKKLRVVAFSCMIVISLAWVSLLCVYLYLRWDVSAVAQRDLILVLVLVNAITIILLPILILIRFRVWLDAARILFLIFAHTGCAIGFTLLVIRPGCPTDDDGVCSMMSVYILMGSWVIPALLFAYAICLAIAAHRYSLHPPSKDPEASDDDEFQTDSRHRSALPMMSPPPLSINIPSRRSYWPATPTPTTPASAIRDVPWRNPTSRHLSLPPTPISTRTPTVRTGTRYSVTAQRKQSLVPSLAPSAAPSTSDSSTRPGRLSKPVPYVDFHSMV